MTTIGVLQERKVARAEQRSQQLQYALDARDVVEQAKGILAERHGVSLSQAFEGLRRRHARNNNRRVRDLCHDILNGDTLPTLELAPDSRQSRDSV